MYVWWWFLNLYLKWFGPFHNKVTENVMFKLFHNTTEIDITAPLATLKVILHFVL